MRFINEEVLVRFVWYLYETIKKVFKDVTFTAVLDRLLTDEGSVGSAQFVDRRTFDILFNYEIYKNAPYKIFDNLVWYESVAILNSLEVRLI